jgi:hypothetical protein
VHVDPTEDGANVGFAVLDRLRSEMLHRVGLSDVLTPPDPRLIGLSPRAVTLGWPERAMRQKNQVLRFREAGMSSCRPRIQGPHEPVGIAPLWIALNDDGLAAERACAIHGHGFAPQSANRTPAASGARSAAMLRLLTGGPKMYRTRNDLPDNTRKAAIELLQKRLADIVD